MPALIRRRGLLWKLCATVAQDSHESGDLDNAESQYRLSVILAKHARGRFHEDVGESLINLADFMSSTGNFAESEKCYREALEIYNHLFGRDNLIAAMIYRVLAELYVSQKRFGEAKVLNARALNILDDRKAS
jgi:tetratricopeptide (TPR) repeat protein